jgi:hypothetical protein
MRDRDLVPNYAMRKFIVRYAWPGGPRVRGRGRPLADEFHKIAYAKQARGLFARDRSDVVHVHESTLEP